MDDFTPTMKKHLMERGFQPGFIQDLEAGDRFAVSHFNPVEGHRVITEYTVVRIVKTRDADDEYSERSETSHQVWNLIVRDVTDLPGHLMYGWTYPIWVKKLSDEEV